MKQLLSTDSPKYKKRLIREINKCLRNGSSVYASRWPYHDRIKSVIYGKYMNIIICTNVSNETFSSLSFKDGMGGAEICASREQ